MTKRQLIDEIVTINQSATPGFLARFEDVDLDEYLQHLRLSRTPRLSGDPHRYDHYFNNCPKIRLPGELDEADVQSESYEEHDEMEEDEATVDEPAEVEGETVDDQPKTGEQLDLNLSPSAYFEQSYEAKAG